MKKQTGDLTSTKEVMTAKKKPLDWSKEEVRMAIASYFEMLSLEVHQRPYQKSKFNAELRKRLHNRSESAVEYKYQNISSVLMALGLPFINGYKPYSNVQHLLHQEIEYYINSNLEQVEHVIDAMASFQEPDHPDFERALVDPPRTTSIVRLDLDRIKTRLPRRVDYAARDESNRALGRAGERWVLEYERKRLCDDGFPQLAEKVDWVADRLGDGLGYDILSFDSAKNERFIEVKTTNGAYSSSFVISRNELDFSREVGAAFCIYRLFHYRVLPKLYILRGDLSQHLNLEPMNYRASFRKVSQQK